MSGTSSRNAGASRTPAAFTSTDGTVRNVAVKLPLADKIADALNDADPFLGNITSDGDLMSIARSLVREAPVRRCGSDPAGSITGSSVTITPSGRRPMIRLTRSGAAIAPGRGGSATDSSSPGHWSFFTSVSSPLAESSLMENVLPSRTAAKA